jgi:hypothetical protein
MTNQIQKNAWVPPRNVVVRTAEIVAIWHEIEEAEPGLPYEDRLIQTARECGCEIGNVCGALMEDAAIRCPHCGRLIAEEAIDADADFYRNLELTEVDENRCPDGVLK